MTWTTPITWAFKQVLSSSLLNQQIRDNLVYLKKKPIAVANLGSTNQTLSVANVWTKITNSDLTIAVKETCNLQFEVRLTVQAGANDNYLYPDIYDVDNNVYLSSGTATPLTGGLGLFLTDNNISRYCLMQVNAIWEDVVEGTHNYELHMKTNLVNAVIHNNTPKNEVWVREL